MSTPPRTRLERALEERGWPVSRLARAIEYEYVHTWRVVKGKLPTSPRFRRLAARALQMSEPDLFADRGNSDSAA